MSWLLLIMIVSMHGLTMKHYTGFTYQSSTAVCKTLSGNQKLHTVRTIFKINHIAETN